MLFSKSLSSLFNTIEHSFSLIHLESLDSFDDLDGDFDFDVFFSFSFSSLNLVITIFDVILALDVVGLTESSSLGWVLGTRGDERLIWVLLL